MEQQPKTDAMIAKYVAGPAVPEKFVVLHVDASVPFMAIARAMASEGLEMRLDPLSDKTDLFVVRPFRRG